MEVLVVIYYRENFSNWENKLDKDKFTIYKFQSYYLLEVEIKYV